MVERNKLTKKKLKTIYRVITTPDKELLMDSMMEFIDGETEDDIKESLNRLLDRSTNANVIMLSVRSGQNKGEFISVTKAEGND